MTDTERQTAILELLRSSALSVAEVDALYARAVDADYWRELNPALSIGSAWDTTALDANPLDPVQIDMQAEKMRLGGYFHTGAVLDPALIGRMSEAIQRLRAERWPAVFGFVYDEFWKVARSPSLVRLVSKLMGKGFRQDSQFWAFYVAGVKGAAGFPPHMDSYLSAESHLTVWIPLTDATLENGCMYVIPRDRVPDSMPPDFGDVKTVTAAELGRYLQAAKALPAPAGSLLGWQQNVIHWGSVSGGHTTPRISIGVEFVPKDLELCAWELPSFDSAELPSFLERVRMIGAGVQLYSRVQERSLSRYEELAQRMRATG